MKKKYEKPVIEKVKLEPSEAVLAACKTSSVAGPNLIYCHYERDCSEIGS